MYGLEAEVQTKGKHRETIRQTDAKADYVHASKAAHTHYSITHVYTSCVLYTLTAPVSSTKVRKAP